MPALLTRITFFLSSYAPLWLIVAVKISFNEPRQISEQWWLGLVFVFIAVASVLRLFDYLSRVRGKAPELVKLVAVRPRDNEAASYLLFYLFPFLNVDFGNPLDLATFCFLFLVLGAIYVRSHLIYINPLLSLFGYHFYEVEVADQGSEKRKVSGLITKESYLRAGDQISGQVKNNFAYLLARQEEHE